MTFPPPILIAAAVPEELSLIKNRITSAEVRPIGDVLVKTGLLRGRSVAALVTGPGPIHMAAALGAVLSSVSCRGLVVVGCAGGFEKAGLRQGDLALATEEICIQLGIEDTNGSILVNPLPLLPNLIKLDTVLVEKAAQMLLRAFKTENFQVHKGPFLTVSTVTSLTTTASLYRKRYMAVAENMEGFAAALLSTRYGIPMIELRCVSNLVAQQERSQWNLDLAFERAQKALLQILEEDVLP